MNWKDLKDFTNTLTDEQLKQPVQVSGEIDCGEVYEACALEEDHINPSGEGIEPVSTYADDPDYKDEEVVLTKGTIMLFFDRSGDFQAAKSKNDRS